MRDFLIRKYHFPKANIVILSEAAGGKTKRPTRANIEREFRDLAGKARDGDRVVILVAGHGSREPDSRPNEKGRFKPDGLEEIFLPADVGGIETWDLDKGVVKNAVHDYEFRDWLQKIRDKKASVWVIVDTCHSASMIRGTDKVRGVLPEKLVPAGALKRARQRAARAAENNRGPAPEPEPPFKIPNDEPDLVVIYAAQSTEPTVERPMPMDGADQKSHGLLTYTLCQVLTQAKAPMTYTELLQRIHAQYAGWGRSYPTPLVEGKDRDREVLGDKEHRGRSRIRLQSDGEGGWKVNAGALHGLTPGSILAVYPPAGAEGAERRVLGYVKTTAKGLGTLEAAVVPCKYGDTRPRKDLKEGGRCEIAEIDYGDLRIKTAVDPMTQAGERLPEAQRQRWTDQLQKLSEEKGSLIKAVMSPADEPRWLLRFDSLRSAKVYLVPAAGLVPAKETGTPASKGQPMPRQFGPLPGGDKELSWLQEHLGAVARAENLLKVISQAQQDERPLDDSGVQVKVEIVRFRNGADRTGEPVRFETGKVAFRKGEEIGIRVSNQGRESVDVNLLLIDSAYGITAVFPRSSVTVDNRLSGGDKPIKTRARITDTTVGLERLVLIAVKGQPEGQYANFAFLAQKSLEEAQRDIPRGGEDPTLSSPLGRLLQNAVYAHGKKRGLEEVSSGDYAFRMLSWEVAPRERVARQK
jgi:hypothetical protein